MKLSVDFSRWTTTKAALAVVGLLGLAGAVGSALAISPTMPAPVKWGGGVENFNASVVGSNLVYNVPAGSNFMLTDLIVTNTGTSPSAYANIYTGAGTCASSEKMRLAYIVVPIHNSVHIPLETGIGFPAGKPACIFSSGALNFNVRGYLFTAAPAS